MGMHIWYGLALGEEVSFDQAIEKITELRRYALTVGFLGDGDDLPPVGELQTGDGSEAWPPTFTVTKNLGNHRQQSVHVPAIEWVGFLTMPGKGTESAHFGLARYPDIFRPNEKQSQIINVTTRNFDGTLEPDLSPIAQPDDVVLVGAKGWSSWSGWCKTQYAHRYGLDHFMHCHLAVIKLLDYAKDIGILDYVDDAGRYWESRSADVLVSNLRENDRIVGAVIGAINDQIGGALEEAGYISVSPITGHPDFERIEAEGRALLGDRSELSPRIGAGIVSALKTIDAAPGASVLAWPAIDFHNDWPPLSETIDAMQRLNPALGLRIVPDRYGISYLGHALSPRNVFSIIMPYRVPDRLTTALTQHNDERKRIHLDGEWTHLEATRIERTPTGSLLIRPCSNTVRLARFSLGKALLQHFGPENIDNIYPGWCLLPHPDGEEFFEFEWSYWPAGIEATAARRPDGKYRRDREYWAVLPGGFFGIRDQYDISRPEFEARCQKAAEMGVPFCVMIDQEAHTLSVFRSGGLERVSADEAEQWRLRELPEFPWKPSWLG